MPGPVWRVKTCEKTGCNQMMVEMPGRRAGIGRLAQPTKDNAE
ncbi:hypothetical protein Hsw_1895 [Hymenobacter swuensis DY53]|uniref:Uncharacterized protein n=1 Tax=Hymenobacter swuensis DY53 TaxID=1227739 RepID=W8F704_9BACT|nr:hypothetical protein Hsw_1895 [Hymenobacter swuensis DY53]